MDMMDMMTNQRAWYNLKFGLGFKFLNYVTLDRIYYLLIIFILFLSITQSIYLMQDVELMLIVLLHSISSLVVHKISFLEFTVKIL